MNGANQKQPWYVYVLAALMLLIVLFSDWLIQHNLILPAVVLLFIYGFGLLLRVSIRQWKKNDDEILADFDFFHTVMPKKELSSLKNAFTPILAVIVFFLFVQQRNSRPVPPAVYVLVAAVLVVNICSVIIPRLRKRRSDTGAPARKPLISSRQVFAFLGGLLPCLFMGFFIGIGIYHGVWWFTLPPGLVFLTFFSRPLVAAVRTVVRDHRDAGAQHLRTGKEEDPWDKPDIDPENYRPK